jgi:hypothetical protein
MFLLSGWMEMNLFWEIKDPSVSTQFWIKLAHCPAIWQAAVNFGMCGAYSVK